MNPFERVMRAVDDYQQRHVWLAVPVAVVRKAGDDQAGSLAALLAYHGFFSMFPLLLVLVTVLGFVVGDNPDLQARLLDSALAQFPILGNQIGRNVGAIQGSGLALAVGIVGTLWGGLGVTQTAQNVMNTVWNVPHRKRPGLVPRLLSGLGLLAVLGGGLIATTVLAGVAATAPGPAGAAWLLATGGSLVVNLGLFLLAFRVLAAARPAWSRLLPGAALGAAGWTLLQSLGGLYVGRQLASASELYGLFGIVMGLLLWLYLAAQLLVYAAELNVVLARRLWPRALLAEPLTRTDRRALTDLARVEERAQDERVDVQFTGSSPAADTETPKPAADSPTDDPAAAPADPDRQGRR